MALPPDVSKGAINRAGNLLRDKGNDLNAILEALDLAGKWRACHAYPINTFQKTLRDKVKKLGLGENTIVAQRLKRMPTIIDKLRRYPDMQLARMQDIGGVRAVVESYDDVIRLVQEYTHLAPNSRFDHKLSGQKDYISEPRTEDGYRSHHLIFSYKNRKAPEYEGLLLEVQIRTKLQHTWATAVETMGIYLGQLLKSRKGDQDWIDFFALTSSAFAHIEGLPLVPRFDHLGRQETFREVARMEKKLGVLDRLSGFVVAANKIVEEPTQGYYQLITLNTDDYSVGIKPFSRKAFEQAKEEYALVEKRASEGEKLEPVLVAVGSIGQLRRAYPNFFLDSTEFVDQVRNIIARAEK